MIKKIDERMQDDICIYLYCKNTNYNSIDNYSYMRCIQLNAIVLLTQAIVGDSNLYLTFRRNETEIGK